MLQLRPMLPDAEKDVIDQFTRLLEIMDITDGESAEVGVVRVIQTAEALRVGTGNALYYDGRYFRHRFSQSCNL